MGSGEGLGTQLCRVSLLTGSSHHQEGKGMLSLSPEIDPLGKVIWIFCLSPPFSLPSWVHRWPPSEEEASPHQVSVWGAGRGQLEGGKW